MKLNATLKMPAFVDELKQINQLDPRDPGRWPLPDAVSPTELWLRAVAAGGQGRYASARADLAALGLLR